MLKKIWLALAQALVLLAAALFVLQWWLHPAPPGPRASAVVTVKEAPEAPPIKPMPMSFRAAAAKALPAVVNVYAATAPRSRTLSPEERLLRRFYGLPEEEPQGRLSLGSGVIVSPDGYILTNNHVIQGADQIAVMLRDGREEGARLVGADADSDLAVLKIDAERLPTITFADPKALQVGDFVLAIGNPFGVGETVTVGIVSATGRSRLGINAFENFIQTDAAINPGNSGGALVDSSGHLVGINTAIYSRTGSAAGIGFAIPADTAQSVMKQLITTGRVARGWLGAEIADVPAREVASGALVGRLVPGGPAASAGLRSGDLITEVNGTPIADAYALFQTIARLSPGSSASLKVTRDQKTLDVPLKLGERPASSAPPE